MNGEPSPSLPGDGEVALPVRGDGGVLPAAAYDATAVPAEVVEDVASLMAGAKSPATWRAYARDWRNFATWCRAHGRTPLPASVETVVWWLQDQAAAGYATGTIERRLVLVGMAHRRAGHDSPTKDPVVREIWSGVRRRLGTAQRQVAPLTIDLLRKVVATCDDSLAGRRDRALLLVGFAAALRRSELAALKVEDLEDHPDGLVITLPRSKTDQEGRGQRIGVPRGSHPETCPVQAQADWREAAGIDAGALLRMVDRHGNVGDRNLSDRAIAEVVKRRVAMIGLDPSRYSGHSLRAGFATSAAAAGASEFAIARQTGHRSMAVLRRYIREGDLFKANAVSKLDL